MNAITTITVSTATLAALRPALQEAGAYAKVARYTLDAMREYAAKVAEVRATGYAAPLTADNVDAALVSVRAEMAAIHAAQKADAADAKAAKAPKAPKAPKAAAPAADEGAELAADESTEERRDRKAAEAARTPRAATVAKLAAAINQGDLHADGTILVTEAVMEANGCGRLARIPASRWTNGAAGKAAAAAGFQGQKVKGGVVFTRPAALNGTTAE